MLTIAEVQRYTKLLERQRQLLERRAEELDLLAGASRTMLLAR